MLHAAALNHVDEMHALVLFGQILQLSQNPLNTSVLAVHPLACYLRCCSCLLQGSGAGAGGVAGSTFDML